MRCRNEKGRYSKVYIMRKARASLVIIYPATSEEVRFTSLKIFLVPLRILRLIYVQINQCSAYWLTYITIPSRGYGYRENYNNFQNSFLHEVPLGGKCGMGYVVIHY